MKPAAELTPEDAAFIVQNFFHAQRQRMIEPYPRTANCWRAAARCRTCGPLRRGPALQRRRPARPAGVAEARVDRPMYLEATAAFGRWSSRTDYSEEDKAALRDIELELLNAVIPAYGEAAREGRSSCPPRRSITRSCRSCATRRSTSARIPTRVRRGTASSTRRTLGSSSIGPWPVTNGCSARVRWASGHRKARCPRRWFPWSKPPGSLDGDRRDDSRATLGISFGRGAGHVDQPERAYTALRRARRRLTVACLFRDTRCPT